MNRGKGAYWRNLDNAAKLYSAASNKKDTRVFRVYCELKEEIRCERLQLALEQTLEKYPLFLSVMRKGLFWHYLEKSSIRPVVKEEYREPCSNLYIRDKRELLFEVTYYNRRINFEVFHALTDGTGALEFMRELVTNYLRASHEELSDLKSDRQPVSISEMEDDGFAKYYSKKVRRKEKKKQKAYQINNRKNKLNNLQITEAEIDTAALAKKSKEYGVSMTVYLTSVFMAAIRRCMPRRQEERPVVLMIPVNLRKFFPSDSMLNFFSWIEPGYQFGRGADSLKEIISHVKAIFETELTAQKMAERMNEYISLEVNKILRFAPLELKNLCISAGTRTSAKEVTAIFSNMGIIKMPEETQDYIERFGIFTSTPKLELCMCSFKDKIHLGFTSRYDSYDIKQAFFDILKKEGIEAELLEPEYSEEVAADSKGMQMFKAFSFLEIVIAVLALCIDYGWDAQLHISFFITGAAVSTWLLTAMAFYKRHNLLKNAMWQLVIVTNGSLIWDLMIGWRGWSLTFVYPLMSAAVLMLMLAIVKIYKREAREYMIYFLMAAVYGLLLPIVFVVMKMVDFAIPSMISIAVSVIMLAALAIFRGRELQDELEKKFHYK